VTFQAAAKRAALVWSWVLVPAGAVLLIGLYGSVMAPVLSVEETERGLLRSAGREHEAAATHFDRALSLDPENGSALKGRGWARIWLGVGYREAGIDFAQVIRLAPDDAEAIAGSGFAKLARGLYPLAEQDFREALQKSGKPTLANLGLGMLAARTGRFDQAVQNLNAMLETAEVDLAVVERGILRGMKGDTKAAQADLELGVRKTSLQLELNNRSAWSHCLRGRAYSFLGLFTGDTSYYSKAAEDLDRAVAINPLGDRGYLARATLLYFQGSYEKTMGDCSEALARNGSQDEAYALRAAAGALAGSDPQVEKDAQAALDLNPRNLWALMARGKATLGRGGGTQGRDDLAQCLALAPSSWPDRARIEEWLRR